MFNFEATTESLSTNDKVAVMFLNKEINHRQKSAAVTISILIGRWSLKYYDDRRITLIK